MYVFFHGVYYTHLNYIRKVVAIFVPTKAKVFIPRGEPCLAE